MYEKYLCLTLITFSFSVFGQLRANNTESYYLMKGTFNSNKVETIKKVIEKELGDPIKEDNDFIWTGSGSFEIILSENSLKMEIQKSSDNQETVARIKSLGDKILSTKNINRTDS